MAKMGFSPQTTPFRPSSLLPPYLWFCRSCTSPSRAFCRLEGRANHRENGLNANLLELNRRKSYATFQHYESEIYHAPKSHFPYSPLKKPSVRRDMEKREELSVEVLNGNFRPLHTAEDWGKATEECKNNKKRYAYSTTVSANLKTLPKEDVAERVERGNRKKYERIDSGLSRMNNDNPIMKVARPNGLENKGYRDSITNKNNVFDEKESASASGNLKTLPEEDVAERVERGSRKKYDRKSSGLSRMNNNNPIMKVARPNGLENKGYQDFITNKNNVFDEKESASASANLKTLPEEDVAKRVERGSRKKYERKGSGVSRMNNDNPVMKVARPNGLENKGYRDSITDKNNVFDEKESASASADLKTLPEEDVAERVERGSRKKYERKGSGVSRVNNDNPIMKVAHSNDLENKGYRDSITDKNNVLDEKEAASAYKKSDLTDSVSVTLGEKITSSGSTDLHKRLSQVYDKVLVVNSISAAREVVKLLTTEYRNFVHACDTEVASIDVKEETPVDHGEVICFSIYSGAQADFGYGKSCVWVDVLDGGGKNLIREFAPFFEDPTIKKVWHNYSFDNHVIENYGLKLSGFYADTMHMARLWNSARRTEGGYSLEALTRDPAVMSDAKGGGPGQTVTGKVSMKNIFGRKKKKKNGSDGKITIIPPVEELQRDDRILWICYSALDSISTLRLYESLEKKLMKIPWCVDGKYEGSMFDNYQIHLRPFGELLVKMEAEGMLVDRSYLAEIEKVAKAEQQLSADRFRRWASKYCPDAKYMNVGSDTQLRQIFFGGIQNRKDPNEFLPVEKEFKVPNVDNIIEEGKKSPTKFRKFVLRKPDFVNIETDKYTAGGWPSVSGDVLKNLAGKVSADFDFADEENDEQLPENMSRNTSVETDITAYGVAYSAFGGGQTGIEACHAIAALCEGCSIDSLISNFIIPLQGNHISGKNGRIHCSLNINTETGRLSARRPNLQNQPALEKDRYKIRQAFIAAPGNSLIVADYGQLELRILAHLANCKSMLDAFKAGGDFHSRTAMNMYPHIRAAVERKDVLLEWHPQSGEDKPPVPLLKDAFASERRKAKMLNFSIAYGKTTVGLARDWKVSREEAQETVNLWYSDRQEVLAWQEERKKQANSYQLVYTLLGRARHFPSLKNASPAHKNHIERAAINTPVQGSAADVAMCAMLEISRNARLKELGWRLLLQVHDEVILEGPTESGEEAKAIVVDCMSKPFDGKNILRVGLSVDAKCAQNWYAAK